MNFKTKKIDWVAFHLRRAYKDYTAKMDKALKRGELEQALKWQSMRAKVLSQLLTR